MNSLIDLTGLPRDLLKIIGSYICDGDEYQYSIESGNFYKAFIQVSYMVDVAKLFKTRPICTKFYCPKVSSPFDCSLLLNIMLKKMSIPPFTPFEK